MTIEYILWCDSWTRGIDENRQSGRRWTTILSLDTGSGYNFLDFFRWTTGANWFIVSTGWFERVYSVLRALGGQTQAVVQRMTSIYQSSTSEIWSRLLFLDEQGA
jgi:hypothetical protein